MNQDTRDYLISEDVDGEQIIRDIRSRYGCDMDEPVPSVRRYYDSFDWGLYCDGGTLEERKEDHQDLANGLNPTHGPRGLAAAEPEATAPGCGLLVWRALRDTGRPELREPITSIPGFARELPPGSLRERLEPLLGVRRLLPMVAVHTVTTTLRMLNEDEKTVARIVIDSNRFHAPSNGQEGRLRSRLRLLPVRGYERQYEEALRFIEHDLGLEPAQTPLLIEALDTSGLQPCGYSSKLNYSLDREERADAATKSILLGLLDTLEANVEGARANLDTEFLHDLRVATRRTRSALGQIKDVLPPEVVALYKERFAWLQQITGPVRDLDVYLLEFPNLRASIPVAMQDGLEPLKTFMLAHYDDEQTKLAAQLGGARMQALLHDWRAYLEAPVAGEPEARNAARSIKAVADVRIWRLYRQVRNEGRAITDDSPATELHELRKSCKKLRYLMEFFQSLYPGDAIDRLTRQTKRLLDNLGGFQDLAVQAQHLRATATQMQQEGMAQIDTLLAMGALIGHMLEAQQQARRDFSGIFARFDDAQSNALFRSCFRPEPKRAAIPSTGLQGSGE